MKQPITVKNFGNTTIVETEKGLEVHASPNMHEGSANRLFKSKRFKRLPKGREVVKEGEVTILVPRKIQYVPYRQKFLFPVSKEDNTIVYYTCEKITNYQVRVKDMGRTFECVPACEVLVERIEPFLFTQKTSNMATAKKAAPKKKVAVKAKAKGKSAGKKEGGPGKIEQIIALHKQGLSNKEIEAKGFNYTTISIQVAKYKKAHGKGKK